VNLERVDQREFYQFNFRLGKSDDELNQGILVSSATELPPKMYRTKYVLKNPIKKSGLDKITLEIYFSSDGKRERIYLPAGEEILTKYWTNGMVA
jgi:hypothetical protein